MNNRHHCEKKKKITAFIYIKLTYLKWQKIKATLSLG